LDAAAILGVMALILAQVARITLMLVNNQSQPSLIEKVIEVRPQQSKNEKWGGDQDAGPRPKSDLL
jgi:hypothetical protein